MRVIAVLGAICALSQAAAAQTSACKSIGDPAARLACYDKAPPSAAAAAPARPPAAAKPQALNIDGSKYVDSIEDEDALVNAKLRNICRGC